MLEGPATDEPSGGRTGRPPLDESPEGLLKAEPRQRLLRLIKKKPGIRVGDLQIAADMTTGSLYHHLNHLKKAGLVETHNAGGVARAYPAGQVVPFTEGPLDSEAVRSVAKAVLRKPGVTSEQIAAALKITPRAVALHLKTLIEAALVERVSGGWSKHYHPTDALRAAFGRE